MLLEVVAPLYVALTFGSPPIARPRAGPLAPPGASLGPGGIQLVSQLPCASATPPDRASTQAAIADVFNMTFSFRLGGIRKTSPTMASLRGRSSPIRRLAAVLPQLNPD